MGFFCISILFICCIYLLDVKGRNFVTKKIKKIAPTKLISLQERNLNARTKSLRAPHINQIMPTPAPDI